jgi:hypothetical protein
MKIWCSINAAVLCTSRDEVGFNPSMFFFIIASATVLTGIAIFNLVVFNPQIMELNLIEIRNEK